MPSVVEVRCPLPPQKLFTKLTLGEESHQYVQPGNLLEVTCSDCARRLSREAGRRLRVLHRFDFLGEFVETVTEEMPDQD
jgi:hypothetical protein